MEATTFNPITKARRNPKSMRLAINAHCARCVGCDVDHLEPGYRDEIRNCKIDRCSLHRLRPYQKKELINDDQAEKNP